MKTHTKTHVYGLTFSHNSQGAKKNLEIREAASKALQKVLEKKLGKGRFRLVISKMEVY